MGCLGPAVPLEHLQQLLQEKRGGPLRVMLTCLALRKGLGTVSLLQLVQACPERRQGRCMFLHMLLQHPQLFPEAAQVVDVTDLEETQKEGGGSSNGAEGRRRCRCCQGRVRGIALLLALFRHDVHSCTVGFSRVINNVYTFILYQCARSDDQTERQIRSCVDTVTSKQG